MWFEHCSGRLNRMKVRKRTMQCGAVLNLHTSGDNLDVRRPRRAAAAAKPGVVLSTTSGAGYPWTARRPFSFDPPISCRASR